MQDEILNSFETSELATRNEDSNRVFWCIECNVPLLQNTCHNCNKDGIDVGSSLKPVFREEYLMFKEKILESHINLQERYFPWILYRKRNYLISDTSKGGTFLKYNLTTKGIILFNLVFKAPKDFKLLRSKVKKNSHYLDDPNYREILINANLPTLIKKEEEALNFIRDIIKKHSSFKIVASFSGGKDSLVTTNLLKSAINIVFNIVYSNTGIEFDETTEYIENYISGFGNLVHLKAKREFLELCDILGPPSRMMRWCCFTQKGAPINAYYSPIKGKVLSFDGIRSDESRLRKDYPRVKENTKITKQLSVYPILNWSELDVWLYIIWKNLKYNPIYDKGFARCGCWACPNNSQFDWYLFRHFYPEKFIVWRNSLDNYTKKEGRYDHSWIWDGSWKSRKVQYKDQNAGYIEEQNDPFLMDESKEIENEIGFDEEDIKESKICLENNDFVIRLNQIIDLRIIEFLKPFGKISEVKISSKDFTIIEGKTIKLKIPKNSKMINIEVLNDEEFPKIKKFIERQIIKAMNCVDCAACINSCKFGAIDFNRKVFSIEENKCTNCLECCTTKYLKAGCVALHYKSKRKKLAN